MLSARHTDALYKISHIDGSIIWRLGGLKSDFTMVGNSRFSRQHFARVLQQNEDGDFFISLFDNAIGNGPEEKETYSYSRGLILYLNTKAMTASVLAEFPHPERRLINSRGMYQPGTL